MSKVKFKEKSWLYRLLSLKIVVFITSLLFQGMRYMTWGERTYKLSITVIFTLLFLVLGAPYLVAILAGHALNYILNGQFYVTYRYLWSKGIMDMNNLDSFLRIITKTAERSRLKDALIIGSFCRGTMSSTSDLDIRLYHRPGLRSALKAYLGATYLRFIGIIHGFPIDVYCFSDVRFLDKISAKEVPNTLLYNRDIVRRYGRMISIGDQMNIIKFIDE